MNDRTISYWGTYRSLALAVLLSAACSTEAQPTDTLTDEAEQRMVEQRPLVAAASLIAQEIDRAGWHGYGSLVIEDHGVALYWKGEPPDGMDALLGRARALAPVRVADAAYTEKELRAAARVLRERLGADAPFHAIKLEPDASGLILGTAPDQQNAVAGVRRILPEAGVPTRVVVERAPTPIARHDDRAPWSGGATIWNQSEGALCTAGFGVKKGSNVYILTAAH